MAQTTPNWPEHTDDAFSLMVSHNPNPEGAASVWPYDEKNDGNFNGAAISPNSGLDSDFTA